MSDQKVEKINWFSIKEAAQYLDIGEPTLYRWMRDRKITFRKVGDSTRFLQEDLDAVVEVHHSQKNTVEVRNYCPLCHSENMVPGDFRTTGLNYFQPRAGKFWTLRTSAVKSEALMCADCGHIAVFGDTEKLAKLCRKRQESETAE
jgi:excisionase family DNA binding protein